MVATRASRSREKLDRLRSEIGDRLRGLLREHRRHLGDPSFEDAEKEEDEIKALEAYLKQFEAALKKLDPDDELFDLLLDAFEKFLLELWKSIDHFEDKLHALADAEAAKGPPPSERFIKLLYSFEDVLHGYADLLSSFEEVIEIFDLPNRDVVLFETLLGHDRFIPSVGFTKSLISFEDLLHRLFSLGPPLEDQEKLLKSFRVLISDLMVLLGSFEALIKDDKPTDPNLAASFAKLLAGTTRIRGNAKWWPLVWDESLSALLASLAVLLHETIPEDPNGPSVPDLVRLKSYEALLHRYARLLDSFADLAEEHAAKRQDLVSDLEDQLGCLEDRLGDFEQLIKDFAPTERTLIDSFEDLLHELAALLKRFHKILKAASPTEALITSFEDLIRGFEECLQSFEDILHGYGKDLKLALSFEDLLHELADLLGLFEKLRGGFPFADPDGVAKSQDDLNDRFRKLLDSMQKLKEAFGKDVPPELVQSDIDLDRQGVARLEALLGTLLRGAPAARASAFAEAMAHSTRTQIALGELLLRQRTRKRSHVAEFRKVVARRGRLLGKMQAAFRRQAKESVFLQDRLGDVAWLQETLEDRAKKLR